MREKGIDKLFSYVLAYKMILAGLEIIAGLLLALVSHNTITRVIVWLTQGELAENPKDFIATHIISLGTVLQTSAVLLIAAYLVMQGLIKLLIVYGLWKRKLIVYPLAAIIVTAFILYQLYRFTATHAAWLFLLSCVDVLYVWLILHEYERGKRHQKHIKNIVA